MPHPPGTLQLDPLQRYTIPEAAAFLRQSRAKTYCDIAGGRLKTIKDGKRRYVPGTEIVRLSAVPPETPQGSQSAA